LLDQTLTDWELICSDNYSDDGAWEYLQETIGSDARVTLFQSKREGMYANWNRCLERARGKYVYIPGSDDVFEPDLLQKSVKALRSAKVTRRKGAVRPKARPISICAWQYIRIDSDGKAVASQKSDVDGFFGEFMSVPHIPAIQEVAA